MLHILPSRSPYGKRFRARWQMLILAISRVCDAVDFTRSNGRYLREADNWNRGIWAKAGERWQELTCERPIRVQGLVQPMMLRPSQFLVFPEFAAAVSTLRVRSA